MSSSQRAFSIKIYLPDGDPEGLKIIEQSNRTGAAVMFSRANYTAAAKKRKEFQQTGVYVLVGPSETSQLPVIYIGEGDPVKPRLDSHYGQKDFWTWGVFFIAKDNSLNKAHVRYLESCLVSMALASKQAILENQNVPAAPNLTEAEKADIDNFIQEDILNICPLIGLGIFRHGVEKRRAIDQLEVRQGDIIAHGQEAPAGFMVFKSSLMRRDEMPTIPHFLVTLRQDLKNTGVVARAGEHYVFQSDHEFSSPSSAAGAILGRAANGRTEWRDKTGKTLREIQTERADIEEPVAPRPG